MNNSLHIETNADFAGETGNADISKYREREVKLVKMIEALIAINENRNWSTLKEELFDGTLASIESRMKSESEKDDVHLPTIYRLQGEKKWAKRYSDLTVLISMYRVELANIRKVNPPDSEANGRGNL